jgi:hypothetical protein
LDPPRLRVLSESESRGLGGTSSQEAKQTVIDRDLRHGCVHSYSGSIQRVRGNASFVRGNRCLG